MNKRTPKGLMSIEEYRSNQARNLHPRDLVGRAVAFTLQIFGFLISAMLLRSLAFKVGGYEPSLTTTLASFAAAAALIWVAPRVFRFFSSFMFVFKGDLVGGGAPAWTLVEDGPVQRINLTYLYARLSKRDREAVEALLPGFTGDITELILVSKALD